MGRGIVFIGKLLTLYYQHKRQYKQSFYLQFQLVKLRANTVFPNPTTENPDKTELMVMNPAWPFWTGLTIRLKDFNGMIEHVITNCTLYAKTLIICLSMQGKAFRGHHIP